MPAWGFAVFVRTMRIVDAARLLKKREVDPLAHISHTGLHQVPARARCKRNGFTALGVLGVFGMEGYPKMMTHNKTFIYHYAVRWGKGCFLNCGDFNVPLADLRQAWPLVLGPPLTIDYIDVDAAFVRDLVRYQSSHHAHVPTLIPMPRLVCPFVLLPVL